jgi:hypothetical protein
MQARVEHVNVEQGTWFIPKSKSASGKRVLRLSSEAQSIMAGRIAQFAQSGWIFPGKNAGTHLRDVEHAHQAVLDATSLAFVVYDLRHYAEFRTMPSRPRPMQREAGMTAVAIAQLLDELGIVRGTTTSS